MKLPLSSNRKSTAMNRSRGLYDTKNVSIAYYTFNA